MSDKSLQNGQKRLSNNRIIPEHDGFQERKNFFEVILEDHPDAMMIFSVRMDCSQRDLTLYTSNSTQDKFPEDYDYMILSDSLEIDRSRIIFINQVHGSQILTLEDRENGEICGDAVLSSKAGYYPSVKTADCQAILILDPVRKVSAAVHAGWRGTVQRITRDVIRKMKSLYGSQPEDLIAALGPSVGTCCYEVDEKVLEPFRKEIPSAERCIRELKLVDPASGKERISTRIDLRQANRSELTLAGVRADRIRDLDLCTHCNDRLFYSYRRDGASPGRLIALAGFRE